MVNEERLSHMIKMAMYDANDGKKCKPMMQYARHDYVSLQMLKGFIAGTFAFVVLLVLWGVLNLEEVMSILNGIQLLEFGVSVGVKYIIFMGLYLVATYVLYQVRYTQGRKKVKKYYSHVKQINKIYRRDEKIKASKTGDWE